MTKSISISIWLVRRMAYETLRHLSGLAFPDTIARPRSERSIIQYKILFLSLCFLSTIKCLESDLGFFPYFHCALPSDL